MQTSKNSSRLISVNLLNRLLSHWNILPVFEAERDKSRKLKYLKSTNGNSDAQFYWVSNKMFVLRFPLGRAAPGAAVKAPRIMLYCLVLNEY